MSNRKPKQRPAKKKASGGRDNARGSSTKKRGKGRNRGGRSKKVDLVKYWGDREVLPEVDEHVTSTPDASTVVDSLGRPPIPGHENASRHYFNLVYERAANLAVALAAAGGLNDFANGNDNGTGSNDDDDDDDEPEDADYPDQ